MLLLFVFVWVKILMSLASQDTIAQTLTKEIGYFLVFGPILLLLAFTGGMADGADAIAPDKQPNAVGRYKNQYQERDWILLRTLSSGLLIRDPSNQERVQFVRWEDVGGLQAKIIQPNRNGLICRISG